MVLTNPFFTTDSVSLVGPTPAASALAPLLFPYYWNLYQPFQVDTTIFISLWMPSPRIGVPIWAPQSLYLLVSQWTQHSSPTVPFQFWNHKALAVDALSQYWQGLWIYMFHQFPLLNNVIQKLRAT